jgi:hypothetical protein
MLYLTGAPDRKQANFPIVAFDGSETPQSILNAVTFEHSEN